MSTDPIDHIIEEWTQHDPHLDATPLAVVGRLLLCAQLCEQKLVAVLKPFGLSFGDFDVLNTLRRRNDEHGTHAGTLAQSSLITSGAMTSRLTRLERRGFITRSLDRSDRRGVLVQLTPDGEHVAKQALSAVLRTDREFLEPLTESQRQSSATLLKKLILHAENPAA